VSFFSADQRVSPDARCRATRALPHRGPDGQWYAPAS